jgi:hypothetical protein
MEDKSALVEAEEELRKRTKLHPRYRHYRFEDLSAVTECLLEKNIDRTPVARGIAICSSRDNFDRSKGRLIAFMRALAALSNMDNSSPVRKRGKVNHEALKFATHETKYKVEYLVKPKKKTRAS